MGARINRIAEEIEDASSTALYIIYQSYLLIHLRPTAEFNARLFKSMIVLSFHLIASIFFFYYCCYL